jgi:CHASE2 domain-containing sensor protein
VIVTPGTHPLEELAVRLATERKTSPGSMLADLRADPHNLCLVARQALLDRPAEARLVLVVDQFEEVFTLCRDEDARRLFVDTLVHVACDEAARARLVMAIRADFYSHCASYRGLAMLLQDHQAIVGPMSDSELRRAIELPAARADLQLEPGLVDRILSDLGDKPGTLPLLSHALLETWARRRGETLTLAGYVEAGGVKEAIARTADAVFLQLPDEQRAIARRIFLRLTEPGRTTEDTSRPANLAELLPPDDEAAAVHDVLDILARARLVTVGLDTAEVAHEALIREWPTLRRWLDEDRAALRAHRRLAEAAQEWERHGRDDDLLYRGVRLVEGLEWRERNPAAANELEQGYLDASAGKQERELREADERSRKEVLAAENLAAARDRARRLRVAFVLLVCLAATVPGIVDGRPDRVVELKTVDARFAIRGEAEVPPDVVIVGIDNATFDDLGLQWPLPRSRHARVIDRLREAGARVIAYQVQFTVATTAREDNALVEAVERAGNVVLGTTEVGPGGQTAIFGGGDMVRSVHARAGLVRLPTEQDGLIRRVQYGFLGLKNFALVAAEMATGRTIRRDELGEGAWIDYVGPSAAIPTYRFSRVLDGQIHPRSFRDKIVVVGSTAASLQDVHETPADAAMSGPEIQANTIATALRGFPLKSARRDVDIALAVMLGLLIPLTRCACRRFARSGSHLSSPPCSPSAYKSRSTTVWS